MEFTNLDVKLTAEQIVRVEELIGIAFPEPLKNFYANFNGGEPDPYCLSLDTVQTVVSETLPLVSNSGRGTAQTTYESLVIEKSLVDRSLFPFAVDAGGDYFFVDCDDPNGRVFYYRSDAFFSGSGGLVLVSEGLNEFFSMLEPESE